MAAMTTTEFAKNIKKTLARLEFGREEIILVRNNKKIARIIPGPPHRTAMEAMGDIYMTLALEAADGWLEQSRTEDKAPSEL